MPDTSAFGGFERGGWGQTAPKYHDHFSAITPQLCAPLLDSAAVGRGTRVLDVATGLGYVAAAAHARGADAIGLDFSAEMVAEARRIHPDATIAQGGAEDLPFADESFDAVVSSFGVLHLAEPPEVAFREALRVLRGGGSFSFTQSG